ncbi:penicillin-binding protein [Persicobacter sp. CCB-QB2]|uniref:penicillin-binding protein n=1 Tax=Persicobacter sp. CCB-QB2 TaxID=1561025 RepID=UPI003460117A
MKNIKQSILRRLLMVMFLMVLFGGVIIARVYTIQQWEDDRWDKIKLSEQQIHQEIPATRGNIYSDNGSLLATSVPFYGLAMDPTVASNEVFNAGIDSLSILLAKKFKKRSRWDYKRQLVNARKKGKRYVRLSKPNINHLSRKEMETWPIFREGQYRGGVIFETVKRRYLPFETMAKRTIGYVNENGQGAGLELSYDKVLSGKPGEGTYRKVAGGNWRLIHDETEISPVHGDDIETTIDVNIQDVTEAALKRRLEQTKSEWGCAIVMETATGQVKAISNFAQNSDGSFSESYNYAVGKQGTREPGSTFKLASMIALLEEKQLNPEDTIDTGDGQYQYADNAIMRDAKIGGYGNLTIQEVFEHSSNIGISRLVDRVFGINEKRFISHLEDMGIMDPLGFQLVGYGEPYFKAPGHEDWSGTTLPWMSIGYELQITPLQTLTLYNAVANGGTMVRPYLVQRIVQGGRVIKENEPQIIRKSICSQETLEKVQSMLEGVVSRGTARNIRNAHYGIAGKTGTARILEKGRYVRKYYTSFAGYFPADHPKYSCIVVLNDPKGVNLYGADVAAPVFKEIADKIYATDLEIHQPLELMAMPEHDRFPVIRAGLETDLKLLCEDHFQLPLVDESDGAGQWVRSLRIEDSVHFRTNPVVKGRVPDVRGMTLRDAIYLLENQKYVVTFKGEGRVVSQSRTPGQKVSPGSQIQLQLSW